jgi:hypothetical protein
MKWSSDCPIRSDSRGLVSTDFSWSPSSTMESETIERQAKRQMSLVYQALIPREGLSNRHLRSRPLLRTLPGAGVVARGSSISPVVLTPTRKQWLLIYCMAVFSVSLDDVRVPTADGRPQMYFTARHFPWCAACAILDAPPKAAQKLVGAN